MSLLIRLLIPLVGYACVATVLSAALGFGYLRHTGKLDDETMYRVLALMHGVDLEEVEKAEETKAADAPAEEPSYEIRQQYAQAATIHFDAKRKQLAASLLEFDYQLDRLSKETEDYANLRKTVENYLTEQKQRLLSGQMVEVREQFEEMDPETQAKPLLQKWLENEKYDEVILLLGSMKARSRRDIINTFDDPEKDIELLFRLQQKMLAGGTTLPYIDEKLNELEQLNKQSN